MLKEYAERTEWREREWRKGRWKGGDEERYGCRLLRKKVKEAGWLGEKGEERRRKKFNLRRERKRRYRERRKLGLVGVPNPIAPIASAMGIGILNDEGVEREDRWKVGRYGWRVIGKRLWEYKLF